MDMFYEGNIHAIFNPLHLFVKADSDNLVQDFNSLYKNLSYDFEDNGECNIIKLTLKADANEFEKYLVSTEWLYEMNETNFNAHIMSRVECGLGKFTNVRPPEFRCLSMEEYAQLLKIINESGSRRETMEKTGKLYDSIEPNEMNVFGFQR